MRKAIARGVVKGAERGRAILVRKTPTDQGQLRASWKVKRGRVTKFARKSILATLINDAPHAGIIEKGARPHPVSKEGFLAIFEWAKRHGFRGARRRFQRGGRTRIVGPQQMVMIYGISFADADVQAAQVALGIVRKIRAHGQVGKFFVLKSLPAVEKAMGREINRAIKDLAKRRKV